MSLHNFSKDQFALKSLVSGVDKWVLSGIVTPADVYYYQPTDVTTKPLAVYINGSKATEITSDVSSLSTGEWIWTDENSLGRNTIYVRLADESSPDSKSDGYVKCTEPLIINTSTASPEVKRLIVGLNISNYDSSNTSNIQIWKEDVSNNFLAYAWIESSLASLSNSVSNPRTLLKPTDILKAHSERANVSIDITASTSEVI